MEELIKTFKRSNGSIAVDGRDLHDFLEVETPYTKWIDRMMEYGFAENVDFSVFDKNVHDDTAFGGVRKMKDDALTLDMAKELSMIQRTKKGKQARQYFISMEKQAKSKQQLPLPKDYPSALRALADSVEENQKLESQNKAMKPKALFADAVETSNTSILVGQLAKLLKQNGVDIGQNKLFKYLRDNHYLGKRGEYYNMPTQYSMEMGLFEIKERTIQNPDGSVKTVRTTKVTGKGQTYFVNKFLK